MTDAQVRSYLQEQRPMRFDVSLDGEEVVLQMTWPDCYQLLYLLGAGLGALRDTGGFAEQHRQFEKRLYEAIGEDPPISGRRLMKMDGGVRLLRRRHPKPA
jgi:hypothetical protein